MNFLIKKILQLVIFIMNASSMTVGAGLVVICGTIDTIFPFLNLSQRLEKFAMMISYGSLMYVMTGFNDAKVFDF